MFLFGVLLFLGAEFASLVAVAGQIGVVPALLILIVVSALGPFVVRRVGIGVLANSQDRLARGELPTRELLDGLVVLLGGVLICVPGFISDALGLLLMIGPLRHLVIRMTGRRLARRIPTIRVRSWRMSDPHSRPLGDDSFHPSRPPREALGSGDDAEL